MKINERFCLPIIKTTKTDVLKTIKKNWNVYGVFEVWIDYIKDFDQLFIDGIVKEYGPKLLIVFRRQDLGPMHIPVDIRLAVIEQIRGSKSMVDLDSTVQAEELKHVRDNKLNIRFIASYHNYKITPPDKALGIVIENLQSYNPEIIKVATMCNSAKDALRLLKLKVPLLENGVRHLILGMGKEGKITRVFGAICGDELIFAPENEEESSAPGQISRSEFEKMFKRTKK